MPPDDPDIVPRHRPAAVAGYAPLASDFPSLAVRGRCYACRPDWTTRWPEDLDRRSGRAHLSRLGGPMPLDDNSLQQTTLGRRAEPHGSGQQSSQTDMSPHMDSGSHASAHSESDSSGFRGRHGPYHSIKPSSKVRPRLHNHSPRRPARLGLALPPAPTPDAERHHARRPWVRSSLQQATSTRSSQLPSARTTNEWRRGLHSRRAGSRPRSSCPPRTASRQPGK